MDGMGQRRPTHDAVKTYLRQFVQELLNALLKHSVDLTQHFFSVKV